MNTDDLFNRKFYEKSGVFLGISVICTAAAGAIQPAELSDEDWALAARISLASAHRGQPVIVFDENLSPAGIRGLRRVRSAVPISDLNDRDEASQNPDGYLYIKQFASDGDRIEFLGTSTFATESVKADCGISTHFFLSRAESGGWKQDWPVRINMCGGHSKIIQR
jgi:hypothetical protein